MKKIIIIGRGGHTKSLVDVIERQKVYEIAGYVVNDESESSEGDYPVLGSDDDLKKIFESGIHNAAIGIGFLGKSTVREKIYRVLKEIGYILPVISDPSAVISEKHMIGEGSFIGKGAIINADVKIGIGCIINTGAIVEHDSCVGDFSHIAVGSVLCGEVSVGCRTLIGANSTVIQGRCIGDACIVGAGETVRKNIISNSIICP